jgi:hypothetical protein
VSSTAVDWRRLAGNAAIAIAAALAVVALVDAVGLVLVGQHAATDFRPYYAAAEDVLRGDSPYPEPTFEGMTGKAVYIYPPLTAVVAVPLTLLSASAADGFVVIAGVLCILGTLLLLDVRDWRCYPIAFLWVAVDNAIGLGNLTVFLVFAAALVWRYRDGNGSAVALGASLAAKLFLWPLGVWLAATRRYRAAVYSCLVAIGLLGLTWAVIGFAGLADYPAILREAHALWADDSYSVYALALDAGVPDGLARLAGLVVAVGLLAASWRLGRRGDERAAFVLAIASALAFSPIVWRHYFALLLVAVAVARPRLGVVWFVPLLMWPVSEGIGNGTSFETAATLGIAAVTIGLSLLALRRAPDGERASTPSSVAVSS